MCQKPQPFPINFAKLTNMLSLHCQSQGSGQTQHASWHWNAIITGMFSCFWDVQAAKRGEWTMAMSSRACHRGRLDWHMLGPITGAGVDGGLPWDCWLPTIRNPRKLGQTWAWALPWAPFSQLLVPVQGSGLRPQCPSQHSSPKSELFAAHYPFSSNKNHII